MAVPSTQLRVAQFIPILAEPQATYSPCAITYGIKSSRDHGILFRASEAVVRESAFSNGISL